jgi:hypothetical protein
MGAGGDIIKEVQQFYSRWNAFEWNSCLWLLIEGSVTRVSSAFGTRHTPPGICVHPSAANNTSLKDVSSMARLPDELRYELR